MEIYLAITQKQLKNFELLIGDAQKDNKSDCFRILIRDKSFTYDYKLWDKVITSDVLFQQKREKPLANFFYMFKKIKSYKNIIKQLNIYKKEKGIKIFISYIEDVLSNFLFFSFNQNPEIIVVEDGILNYYSHNFHHIDKMKFTIKKIISFYYGIPFEAYEGHSSGVEYKRVTKQFLTLPEAAFISKKALQLPIKQKSITSINENLFLIGQDTYAEILGKELYQQKFKSFINSIYKELENNKLDKIYYKPRYKISNYELSILYSIFRKESIEILTNGLSSEEVYFEHLNSKYIASFNSSTMLNIYSQISTRNRNDINFYFFPIVKSEVIQLFENLGFERLKE